MKTKFSKTLTVAMLSLVAFGSVALMPSQSYAQKDTVAPTSLVETTSPIIGDEMNPIRVVGRN
jgi:hypothetical protein